jgi:uncharacterized membrane protein
MEAQLSPPSPHMPNLAVGYFVCAAITSSAVSVVAVVSDIWKLTSFLLLGAILGDLWAYLSKAGKEETRITRARVLAGLIFGVCIPRLVEWISPWKINLESADPLAIIALSFILAVCGFFSGHTALRKVETDQKKTGNMLYSIVKKKIASDAGNQGESEEKTDEEKTNDAGNTS